MCAADVGALRPVAGDGGALRPVTGDGVEPLSLLPCDPSGLLQRQLLHAQVTAVPLFH